MKKLLVLSSAPLIKIDKIYFAYSPYEKEMQIWAKHASKITFCCPIWNEHRGLLHSKISFPIENIILLSEFDLKSFFNIFKSFYISFYNCFLIFKAMHCADHIHLRCPGNMGLLACFVQILFPFKKKSAKYAGNWDPKSKQPWSYRLQKWILSNTYLTKNMQVLVYGEWQNQTTNVKPFFTASYHKSEIIPLQPLSTDKTLRFIFAGSLVEGKNPIYALEIVSHLRLHVPSIQLDFYGEGILREKLQQQINQYNLGNIVHLHGNQNTEVLKKAYQSSHFILLPSKSEGWPKVLAEGMFWGCVPIATPVSCVENMLDHGNRGVILQMNLEKDVAAIKELFSSNGRFQSFRQSGADWSRLYTLDYFESEIKKIILS